MTPSIYLQLLRNLADEAALLTSRANVPICLKTIRKTLGVAIELTDSLAHPAVAINALNSRKILFPRQLLKSRPITFCRFLVAHEIGHIVLERLGVNFPVSRKEYWAHEDLCDDFARHLLIPDRYLHLISNSPESAEIAVGNMSRLAINCSVNPAVSAFRLARSNPKLVFARVGRHNAKMRIVFNTFQTGEANGRHQRLGYRRTVETRDPLIAWLSGGCDSHDGLRAQITSLILSEGESINSICKRSVGKSCWDVALLLK
jgi:hypothetical protein